MKDIHIKNKELLDKKINKFQSDGAERLHLVSDFDKTLTKCFTDGQRMVSTYGIIRHGGYLSEDYSQKAFELHSKYFPIEEDTSLDNDYKLDKMKEWWKAHEQLLVSSGFSKKTVQDIVQDHPKILRNGAAQFFETLNKEQIPLLIFSSGIGNIIEALLGKENLLTDNVHIISNMFKFDENGYATGYQDEIIHIMNKSENRMKGHENIIEERKNVILLGDSLEDLNMVNNNKEVINIGFLNEDVENKLELYKSRFDIVITNDGPMDYVNQLIESLL